MTCAGAASAQSQGVTTVAWPGTRRQSALARATLSLVALLALRAAPSAAQPLPGAPVPTPIAPPTPAPVAADAPPPADPPAPAPTAPAVPPMPPPAPPTVPAAALDAGVGDAGADAGAQGDAGAATDDAPAAAGGATPMLPEEHRPRLSIALDPSADLHTGDLTTLRLTVRAAPGDDVTLPDDQRFGERTSSVTPDPIELVDSRVRVETRDDQGRDFHFELDLLLLEPGEHEVGPLRVRVLTADGQVGVVEADVQRVSVASVLGNEPDAQPFPPTEPVRVMQDDDRPYWVLGGLGVLLVGLLLGYLLRRYLQKRAQAPKPAPPPMPPWDVAAGELSWLAQTRRQHIEEGKWDEWVDKLSDVLRGYLGARYEFDGLECTTGEIAARLKERRTDKGLVERVEQLLEACDLVKFANSPAGDEETDQMLAAALVMVRETRPIAGAVPMPASPVVPAGPGGAPDATLPTPAPVSIPETRVGAASSVAGDVEPDPGPDAGTGSAPQDPSVSADAPSGQASGSETPPEDEILPTPRRIVAKAIPLTNVGADGRTRMEPFPLGARVGSGEGDGQDAFAGGDGPHGAAALSGSPPAPAPDEPDEPQGRATTSAEARAQAPESVPTLPGFADADDQATILAQKAREAREAAAKAAAAAAAAEAAAEAAAAAAAAARVAPRVVASHEAKPDEPSDGEGS